MAKQGCGEFGCYGIFDNEGAMYQALYWWVQGHRSLGLALTIEKSIEMFKKATNLAEDQMGMDVAKTKYNRFQTKYIERVKNG